MKSDILSLARAAVLLIMKTTTHAARDVALLLYSHPSHWIEFCYSTTMTPTRDSHTFSLMLKNSRNNNATTRRKMNSCAECQCALCCVSPVSFSFVGRYNIKVIKFVVAVVVFSPHISPNSSYIWLFFCVIATKIPFGTSIGMGHGDGLWAWLWSVLK